MANETTSTSQATLIATEIQADGAIQANLTKHVFNNLLHHDNMDGAGSGTKRYAVESDLGASSGGTEGTAITANSELTMGSAVSLTPTEGVLDRATITEKVIMRRLGGMPADSVIGVFQSEDQAMLSQLLAPDIRRLVAKGMQKIEADALALLSAPSNSVGSTGVDASIMDLLTAVYQGKTQQMHRPPSEKGFVLTPNQTYEVDLEAVSTGGGVAGAIWNTQADFSIANRPDDGLSALGRIGTFLRYSVYEYDHELRVTANAGADVVGAFMDIGNPNISPDAPELGGKPAFGVYLERHFLKFRYQYDAALRAMIVVMNADYIHGELVDSGAVGIITDAV